MKKMIVIFMIMFIFSGCKPGESTQGKYIYPVVPGSNEWAKLNSHNEMVDICQIPENVLGEMNNTDLIDSVLDYPLFDDVLAYADKNIGFKEMSSQFNGFTELYHRKNIGSDLISKYEDMNSRLIDENDEEGQLENVKNRLALIINNSGLNISIDE